MKVTDSVMFELENLKNTFILTKDGEVLIVTGWKIEEIVQKPSIFSSSNKSYKKLVEIHFTNPRQLSSKYHSVIRKDLEWSLDFLRKARERFITMRCDLDAFGYCIKGKRTT